MNSNSIEQNWDAIWYRVIENFLATMVLEKKKDSLKKLKSVKTPFHLSLLGN
jgi:hypothetical protein